MIRNGLRTWNLLRDARASSHWSAEQLRAGQERQLRRLLEHAYTNVPLYRELYTRHRFHPENFRTLDDLERIPPLEKSVLRDASAADAIAAGLDPARCLVISTSGSTGQPLRIHLDEPGQRWQRVAAWRILFEHGFRWTDRTAEIRMTPGITHPVQRLGVAPKLWLSLLDGPERWAEEIERYRPEVIVAGAGTLHALAAHGLRHRPRLIVSDSETLYPDTRSLVRERLEADPVDVYGLVELSNFAWQCEQREGFHWSADSHIVEVLEGEIVATALGQLCQPVIRYRTGDRAETATGPCSCGRTLPRLAAIYGRALDSVELPDGRTLFWPFFHELLGARADVRQWRVIQSRVDGSLRVELEAAAGAATEVQSAIAQAIRQSVKVSVACLDRIPLAAGEKFRAVLRR